MVILHIAERTMWEHGREIGQYWHPSLETEGFIHCSTPRQVISVANSRYRGRDDLVLLVIDPDHVDPEIRYEGETERFPHIYGSLNTNAVLGVLDFPPGADGLFTLPDLSWA